MSELPEVAGVTLMWSRNQDVETTKLRVRVFIMKYPINNQLLVNLASVFPIVQLCNIQPNKTSDVGICSFMKHDTMILHFACTCNIVFHFNAIQCWVLL